MVCNQPTVFSGRTLLCHSSRRRSVNLKYFLSSTQRLRFVGKTPESECYLISSKLTAQISVLTVGTTFNDILGAVLLSVERTCPHFIWYFFMSYHLSTSGAMENGEWCTTSEEIQERYVEYRPNGWKKTRVESHRGWSVQRGEMPPESSHAQREREREVTWHCAKTVGRRDSDFDPMNYILSRSLLLR